MSKPSVPDPARLPTTMTSGYFRLRSSGMDIFPIVAQVAAEEPEMAAKIAQPKTFVCSSRPGSGTLRSRLPRATRARDRVWRARSAGGVAVGTARNSVSSRRNASSSACCFNRQNEHLSNLLEVS